jgi:O-antigen/teichoic acid export membrane protein
MRTGMSRFVRDVGLSFASLAISAAVHFALRVFLARYLGEGDLGLYTLSFTVYSFGILFGAFGIGAALTKYVAEFREDASRTSMLLTNGIIASFAIGCIMGLLLYAGASTIANRFFNMPELAALLRIVSIAFPFIAMEKATLGFLNGLRQMRLFAIINFGTAGSRLEPVFHVHRARFRGKAKTLAFHHCRQAAPCLWWVCSVGQQH